MARRIRCALCRQVLAPSAFTTGQRKPGGQCRECRKALRAEQPQAVGGAATNLEAITQTVTALRLAGRLENVDAALVRACLSIADALDENPDVASLWREYRTFEQRLRGVGESSDDGIARALEALSTPMGDPAKP